MKCNNKVILEEEFNYFLVNLDDLLKKYEGKYVVIKNNCVLGAYGTIEDAIIETQKTEPLGTFLVQKCDADKNNYTCTYHSRAYYIN